MLSKTPQTLIDSLKILDKIDSTLPSRALDYVMTGEPEQVLNDFSGKITASELFGSPGRLYYGFYAWSVEKLVRKRIKAGLKARHQFYSMLGKEDSPELNIYIRFGRLLEAIDQKQSLQRIAVAGLPKWFQYLANDALHASMCWNSTPLDETSRGAWTLSLMHALLEEDGLDGTLALRHAFERKGIAEDQHINFDWLLRESSLHPYVEKNSAAFVTLTEQLSSAGRCLLARVVADNQSFLEKYSEVLITLLVDKNKKVRGKASRRVDRMNTGLACQLLANRLNSGALSQRKLAAQALGMHFAQQGRSTLEDALARTESGNALQPVLQTALLQLEVARRAEVITPPTAISYESLADSKLGDDVYQMLKKNRIDLLNEYQQQAQEEIESNKNTNEARFKSSWRQTQYADYQQLSEQELSLMLETLNNHKNSNIFNDLQIKTFVYKARIFSFPEFSLYHVISLLQGTRYYRLSYFWHEEYFQLWLAKQDKTKIDLRALAEVTEQMGLGRGAIAGACLCSHHNEIKPWDQLANERIWPFFAKYTDLIEEGLGIRPKKPERYHEFDIQMSLDTLKTFPYLPSLFVPRLMELALGESANYRESAQSLLLHLPDIGRQVSDALSLPKQEVRITSAKWLAKMNYREAIPSLSKALKCEKREAARSVIMAVLEKMGEKIEEFLLPETLLLEAKDGLISRSNKGIPWFDFSKLPDCYWQKNNELVNKEIIKWWVILASKLKTCSGKDLLERYLMLLTIESSIKLGQFVLNQFISYDLLHPSLLEAKSFASANVEQRYQYYQESSKCWTEHYAEQGRMNKEQVFNELLNEKLGEYIGNSINEKGILALAIHVPSNEIIKIIQNYLTEHYQRRAQIEALLELAARKNNEHVINLLTSISQGYRTSSIQAKALLLLNKLSTC